jgi:hypothetical protein
MVPMLRIINKPHADREILTALHVAADELEVTLCWYYRGDFHFRLPGEWTVSITPESAERVRVETWSELLRRDRKWARSGDSNRLRHLVRTARETALDSARGAQPRR